MASFEIIAKRPIAQHFEHSVVIGVVAYLLQIVVLSGYAETLLGIGNPRTLHRSISQKNILELVHPRVGKHQGWIILNHHWCGRNNLVLFGGKKVKKGFAYLFLNPSSCNVKKL